MSKLTKEFTVNAAPEGDVGRWRIRISEKDLCQVRRHTLVKVTSGKRSGYFVRLGHEKGNDIVQADFDVREHLGLGNVNSVVTLEVEVITGWRKLCWYLQHRDPYVYVPAWVGLWSLVLGGAGILLGVIGALPVLKPIFGLCD